jgi:hypothetical protein
MERWREEGEGDEERRGTLRACSFRIHWVFHPEKRAEGEGKRIERKGEKGRSFFFF